MAQSSEPTPEGFSIGSRLKSFVYAGRGIRTLVTAEHNAWVHLAASLTVVAVGAFLRISIADWRWLIAAMGMVWLAEALNTAVEELCDHVTPDRHPAIGRIKDIAAGAVLIASIAAGLIGLLTLGPPLVRLL